MRVRVLMMIAALSALFAGGLLTAACDKGLTDPADNKMETFTGAIAPGGNAKQFTIDVTSNGEYSVFFNSITPPLPLLTYPTGISLVPVSQGACQVGVYVGINESSTPGKQALPTLGANDIVTPGQYCLFVYDVGFFPTTETVVVTVSHP